MKFLKNKMQFIFFFLLVYIINMERKENVREIIFLYF